MATPTQKALVSAKADAITAGGSWAFTLPNTGDGAAVGQFALLILAQAGGTSTTDLSGWTALSGTPTTGTGSSGRFYVWTKTLVSGDLGLTVNFTTSAICRYAAACLVVDPAVVNISGTTETQTSGTVMASPSVTPTVADGLLVTIFGPIVNTTLTTVTWTATAPITEIVDICSVTASGTARNATMLVATEALTSSAATGTRTGTPTGNIQRQTISVVLAAAAHAVLGTGALGLSSAATVVKVAPQRGSSGLGLASTATVRKTSPVVGSSNGGFSSTATPRRISLQLGLAAAGLSSSGAGVRIATVAGTTKLGFSASGTERKVVASSGTAALTYETTGLVGKSSPIGGRACLGLTAQRVSLVRVVTGSCSLVLHGASTPRKTVTFLATNEGFIPGADTFPGPNLFPGWPSEGVLFSRLTTAATGTVAHGVSGTSSCVVAGTSISRKTTAISGSAFTALSSRSVARRSVALGGVGGLSLIAAAPTRKNALITARVTTGLTATGLVRKTAVSTSVTTFAIVAIGAGRKTAVVIAQADVGLVPLGRVGRYALSGTLSAAVSIPVSVKVLRALGGKGFAAVEVDSDITVYLPIIWGLMSSDDREAVRMTGG